MPNSLYTSFCWSFYVFLHFLKHVSYAFFSNPAKDKARCKNCTLTWEVFLCMSILGAARMPSSNTRSVSSLVVQKQSWNGMPEVKFSNYGCPRHFFHTHSYTIFYRASAGSRTKLTTVAPLSQCNGRAYHQELQLLSTLEDQGKFLAVGQRAQCPNLFDEKQWTSLSLLLWSHQISCESLLATSAQQHFSGHIRGSESSTCLGTFHSYSFSASHAPAFRTGLALRVWILKSTLRSHGGARASSNLRFWLRGYLLMW